MIREIRLDKNEQFLFLQRFQHHTSKFPDVSFHSSNVFKADNSKNIISGKQLINYTQHLNFATVSKTIRNYQP